jgi:regulation of enolase protein 1 (concanavalin A-like superfamily)
MDDLVSKYRRPSLALLGALIDPSKDCRLDKDEDNYRIKIEIPGKTHTLSTDFLNRSGKPLYNAPMALAEVNGDFTALVDVVGDISPGTDPPRDRTSRGVPFTYQSAGLVLYQDKNNYVRLERFVSIVGPAVSPVMLHRVVVEAFKDGKAVMNPIQLNAPRGDVMLAIERRGGKIRCLVRPNGVKAAASLPGLSLELPAKVRVGLVASNISAKPFSATFGDFVLITDINKLKAELGRD